MALKRAVIYCRCSTEEESQADALKNQVLESEACIREQGWVLVDRYVELKSGTTTKGRAQYNRLFDDLTADRFDIIVIKSQDRLMRNVKDWYLFLDRMLSHGKRLFMYIERKFYTADDALITGIKAILAEEYSRELSKKINNAHRHRQIEGGKAMLTSRVFGFLKERDGSLKVEEEEGQIIRKIYEYSAAGYGSRAIANIFLNQGYVKRTGSTLTATSVGRIIRNPLYKGVMIMNRFHYDFETKQTIKVPKEQWIYKEGAVPAIVDAELWERANQAMTDRGDHVRRKGAGLKGDSTGKYHLSGKLVCGQCGKPYYRTWRRGCADKERFVIEWKCSGYLEKGRKDKRRGDSVRKAAKEFDGGCNSVHLEENTVFELLEQVSGRYWDFKAQDKDSIINHALRILKKALGDTPVRQQWEWVEKEERRLESQKDFLLTKFLEGVISDKDYRKRDDVLEQELAGIRKQKDELIRREWEMRNLEQRIETIKKRLENGGMEKAAVNHMLKDIREIRVHEWQMEIRFDPMKMMELSSDNTDEDYGISEFLDYPFGPETERGRYLDRRRIVEKLKVEPGTTARKLAGEMGRSVYMVRNRMEELIKGGYIRFQGRGGHGVWEVLKELPCKEESIRAGGL